MLGLLPDNRTVSQWRAYNGVNNSEASLAGSLLSWAIGCDEEEEERIVEKRWSIRTVGVGAESRST